MPAVYIYENEKGRFRLIADVSWYSTIQRPGIWPVRM